MAYVDPEKPDDPLAFVLTDERGKVRVSAGIVEKRPGEIGRQLARRNARSGAENLFEKARYLGKIIPRESPHTSSVSVQESLQIPEPRFCGHRQANEAS
jgi:hypothetical protein